MAAFALSMMSAIVIVEPGEVIVVRRFGRALPGPWGPGLRVGLPWGFDRRDRVRLDEVRRVEAGFRDEAETADSPPGAGEFLTADGNFVRARVVVQYRISDPTQFVTTTDDPERWLSRVVEAALSRAFARQGIDSVLRAGRAEAASVIEQDLSSVFVRSRLGISILSVNLTDAAPPTEVSPDFADAQAASSERDRRGQEALTESLTKLSRARSEAQSRREFAQAKAGRATGLAKAKAARFVSRLEEAERSRSLTLGRIYSETLRELLPKIKRKIVVDASQDVDLSLYGVE